MRTQTTRRKWWHYPVAVIAAIALAPWIVAIVASYLVYSTLLHLLIWVLWCSRGIHVLFVYSDSPKWRDYIEHNILPRMPTKTVVLNWSERRRWKHLSLTALVFRHFGGTREFNPLVVVFRPGRRTRTFRFWKAFLDVKQGKAERLVELQAELLECVANL